MQKRWTVPSTLAVVLLFFGSVSAHAATLPDFVSLVKNNRAAVVNISTSQTIETQEPAFPGFQNLPQNSPFNQFFKHYFGNQGGTVKQKVRSLGSGFLISKDGYILTNAHVVNNADKIIVRLYDHEEQPARLIGLDRRTDVALLKIKGHNYPTLHIGNSDKIQVGQWVLAIGSPFGLDYTATHGIISALHRSLPNDTYVPFIQTDVPVNPGNSGGPLFNTAGQVVGINSEIYSNTGGYMGLSFAIPINVAMRVAEQLKSTGHVTRGWLGVAIQPVTQSLAEAFHMHRPHGALVADVMPNSPASKAGVESGDILLTYNGHPVDSSAALPPMVAATPIGKTVDIGVLRQGHRKTIEVKIEQLPGKQAQASVRSSGQAAVHRLNIAVTDLSEAQRNQLGIGNRGVLVGDVGPGPAADAGLQPGDVILMINHVNIRNTHQLAELLHRLPHHKTVPILVQRDGNSVFLALRNPN